MLCLTAVCQGGWTGECGVCYVSLLSVREGGLGECGVCYVSLLSVRGGWTGGASGDREDSSHPRQRQKKYSE